MTNIGAGTIPKMCIAFEFGDLARIPSGKDTIHSHCPLPNFAFTMLDVILSFSAF